MKNTMQVPEILSDVLCNDLPKRVNEKDECKTPQSFYLKPQTANTEWEKISEE